MSRTVVDLDAGATVLDAGSRIGAAAADTEIVLVVAAGAPVLRNAVFLDVARRLAGERRVALVTSDARARSLAASVHLPAYASIAALDRREMDPTERLTPIRRAALAGTRPVRGPRFGAPGRRALGIAASLLAAGLILAGVLVPEARVVVAPATEPLAPLAFDLHAGPGGDLTPSTLTATVETTLEGSASGSRTEEIKAVGAVQFSNKQTFTIRIPAGTEVRTNDGIRFVTTEEVTLPASAIVTFFDIFVGRVDAPVEAVLPGEEGNVPAGRIVVSPQPADYEVTNPEPTGGGEIRTIPIVERADYDALEARAEEALDAAAQERLATWEREAEAGTFVVPRVRTRLTSLSPPEEVVGQEVERFTLRVTGIASTYSVRADDIREHGLARLNAATEPGWEVLPATAVIELGSPVLADDGVRWPVTARAVKARQADASALGRLLAGRSPTDVEAILAGEGVSLVRIERIPSWWPLLPVLDARILVDVRSPAVATGP